METDHIPLKYWKQMEVYEKEGFKFHLESLENFMIREVTYKIFPHSRFMITDYIVKFGKVTNFKTKWNEVVVKVMNESN